MIDTKFVPEQQPRDLLVKLYICTDREYAEHLSTMWTDLECKAGHTWTNRCTVSAPINASEVLVVNLPTTNRYRFYLFRCGEGRNLAADIRYEAVNPGNDQLPYGDKPLPTVYHILSVAWAIFLALTIFRLIRSGDRRNSLHFAFAGVVLLKTLAVLVYDVYWLKYRSGFRLNSLGYSRRVVFAASEAALFGALFVVSKGWRITRITMRGAELRTLSVALVLLLATLSFFSFYSDDYYFLSLMIMYFFMLPKIYAGVTKNIRSLETQIWMANNVRLPDLPLSAFNRKLKMFKVLRFAVVAYLGSILLINSLRIVVVWYWDWINVTTNEFISLILIIVIVHVLRPGPDGVFTDMAELAHLATLQTLIERSSALINNDAPRIIPWNTNATLIIQYPSKPDSSPKKDPDSDDEEKEDPSSKVLAMALLEDYDKKEKFESSQIRPSSPSP